jgi:hypothetical protein
MSTFDAAVGMDHTTLDGGIAQLYAAPDARAKLFKGSESGESGGLQYTASFDILAAPLFDLAPGPAITARWPASIDQTGSQPKGPLPTTNLFVLTFPSFEAKATIGTSKPVEGTANDVTVFCTVTIADGVATLKPLSVWLDESHMTGWDKLILNGVILKKVVTTAQQMLAALKIPPLTFTESGITVDFMPPVVTIQGGMLVLATSLTSTNRIDLTGFTWPAKPLFVLVSGNAITKIGNDALKTKLAGTSYSDSGSVAGGTAKWDASATIKSATMSSDESDRTRVSASIGVEFSAELKPFGIGGPCAIGAATGSM